VPDGPLKHCLLAVDTPQGPRLLPLALPPAATIADALRQAQIDAADAATGIFGVRRELSAVPGDGDRIEVYRPLTADPRQRRRQQLRAARRRDRAG
jgi:putative ubiquitin-RnfH superfamily antitoxin RatB of RatAB toxin-antitoxin module